MVLGVFLKYGSLSGAVTTDRTGYIPGDTIFINAELENSTSIPIKYYSLKLVRKLTYFANGQTISEKCTLSKLRRDQIISPGSNDTWEGVSMTVPHNTKPTGLGGPRDSIIQLEHFVELQVKQYGMLAKNLVIVRLPITIGTHT